MPTNASGSPPAARDAFTDFRLLDWIFVVLVYVFTIYLILQGVLLVLWPGVYRLDFMPLVNGALFISIAWGAVRLDRRIRELIVELDRSSSVVFPTSEDRQVALAAVAARSARCGGIGAAVLAVSVTACILSYAELLTGSRIAWSDGVIIGADGKAILTLFEVGVMLAVCVPAGTLAGRFLGNMVSIGWLLETLHELGYDVSGFAGAGGARTVGAIESIFDYSAKATVALTAVLGLWWIVLTLDLSFVDDYRDWRLPFLFLWLISFAAFMAAVYLPVRAFRRRIEQIYGGPQAINEAARQNDVARNDAKRLRVALAGAKTRSERRRLERRLKDLEDFMLALETRVLRRPLLDQRFLNAWLLVNLLAFAVPLALAPDPTAIHNDPKPRQKASGDAVLVARRQV